jgi:MarR family transcriptional regulator, 2-MHQ and catechol-resistance regulon repressor
MADLETETIRDQAIECFWETVPPVWNRIRSYVNGIATESFGITVEQFHILRHIQKGKGSISKLADEKQISRSAISQVVDTLVEKGLIIRHQALEDRRWVHLELTPAGNELLNAIFKENRNWMKAKMNPLSLDELKVLIEAMTILKNVFQPTH